MSSSSRSSKNKAEEEIVPELVALKEADERAVGGERILPELVHEIQRIAERRKFAVFGEIVKDKRIQFKFEGISVPVLLEKARQHRYIWYRPHGKLLEGLHEAERVYIGESCPDLEYCKPKLTAVQAKQAAFGDVQKPVAVAPTPVVPEEQQQQLALVSVKQQNTQDDETPRPIDEPLLMDEENKVFMEDRVSASSVSEPLDEDKSLVEDRISSVSAVESEVVEHSVREETYQQEDTLVLCAAQEPTLTGAESKESPKPAAASAIDWDAVFKSSVALHQTADPQVVVGQEMAPELPDYLSHQVAEVKRQEESKDVVVFHPPSFYEAKEASHDYIRIQTLPTWVECSLGESEGGFAVEFDSEGGMWVRVDPSLLDEDLGEAPRIKEGEEQQVSAAASAAMARHRPPPPPQDDYDSILAAQLAEIPNYDDSFYHRAAERKGITRNGAQRELYSSNNPRSSNFAPSRAPSKSSFLASVKERMKQATLRKKANNSSSFR
eukprot:TRINITY_DN6234_c0_g1_i1.p1 TRINITY_DN6234_c0_g1~~TRINITY_DN6234_c0_g1_i1.p1  ORF type:complete len:495 (-),score=136.94 TRINITY_DN6234_c0_g1_i1:77-1561(-)